MGSLSIGHMLILFLIVLIIFGPKNLPKVGQALGKGIREFKDAARGLSAEIEEDERREVAARREIPQSHSSTLSQTSRPAEDVQHPPTSGSTEV